MIKKILDWILGKNETPQEAAAPYKVEAPVVAEVVEPQVQPAAEKVDTPIEEVAPVTVKAKYKKSDLGKMTKAELLDLAAKHGVEVKARAPKAELVKALSKV